MAKDYDGYYEMYIPESEKHHSHHHFSTYHFNIKKFLKNYVYFRIQEDIKDALTQFLPIFIIGLVLNYVYYQTFSLNYLFIGGLNQWFSILMYTLNYGLRGGYDLFYLIINGVFYFYFYYSFIRIIKNILTNLDDKDTWITLGWFTLIFFIIISIFPKII